MSLFHTYKVNTFGLPNLKIIVQYLLSIIFTDTSLFQIHDLALYIVVEDHAVMLIATTLFFFGSARQTLYLTQHYSTSKMTAMATVF